MFEYVVGITDEVGDHVVERSLLLDTFVTGIHSKDVRTENDAESL